MDRQEARQLLGLGDGPVSVSDLRQARNSALKAHHPDMVGPDPAEIRRSTYWTAQINAAHDLLQAQIEGHYGSSGSSDNRDEPERQSFAGAARRAQERAAAQEKADTQERARRQERAAAEARERAAVQQRAAAQERTFVRERAAEQERTAQQQEVRAPEPQVESVPAKKTGTWVPAVSLVGAVVLCVSLIAIAILESTSAHTGTITFGSGGTGCIVIGQANSFPTSATIHMVTSFQATVPVGETITLTVNPPGGGPPESNSLTEDIAGTCGGVNIGPNLPVGHYLMVERAGNQIATGEVDITK